MLKNIERNQRHAPSFFPRIDVGSQCFENSYIHHGIAFRKEFIPVTNKGKFETIKLEVLKAVKIDDEDLPTDSKTLYLFLHGFPDFPQVWSGIISALHKEHVFGIFPVSRHFWAVGLPGWGNHNKNPISSCRVNYVSEFIVDLIFSSGDGIKNKYDNIYLVGHGFGGILAWQVAQDVSQIDQKILTGLISFTPHPSLIMQHYMRIPAEHVYFYPFLSPILGEMYLAADDFEMVEKKFFQKDEKNDKWVEWYSKNDFEWRNPYIREWKKTGISPLTCYYRDNFEVKKGVIYPLVSFSVLNSIDPQPTNILMVHAEEDVFLPQLTYVRSFKKISLNSGQVIQYRKVPHADHYDVHYEIINYKYNKYFITYL